MPVRGLAEKRRERISKLVDWIRSSPTENIRYDTLQSFANFQKSGTYAALKKDMIALSYATTTHRTDAERIKLIPKSHRKEMMLIRRDLAEGKLDPAKCSEAVMKYLMHSPTLDIQERMARIYKTDDPEILGLQKKYGKFLERLAAIKIKKESEADPVRVHTSIWNIAGGKINKEIPNVLACRHPELTNELKHELIKKIWQENFLRIQSIPHYERAKEMFISQIPTIINNIRARQQMRSWAKEWIDKCCKGNPALEQIYGPGKEELFFQNLYKTLRRWGDPLKEKRKIPYYFENALVREYRFLAPEQQNNPERMRTDALSRFMYAAGQQLSSARVIYAKAESEREDIIKTLASIDKNLPGQILIGKKEIRPLRSHYWRRFA